MVIGYGMFINAVIDFVIVAFAMFVVVKLMNAVKRKEGKGAVAATLSRQEMLLEEIRDLLKGK